MKNKIKRWGAGYLLLLPSLIIYSMFLLYPIFKTIYNSFFIYNLTTFEFVGFNNYINLFTDSIFIQSIKNTLLFVFISTPLVLIFSLAISLIIAELKKQYLYLSLFYLPHIASGVSIFLTWKMIYSYNGLINNVFGLNIDFLGNSNIAIYSLILVLIYIAVGQPIILLTGAINNIPEEYYEAAEIDGINWLQRIYYITIPLIKPTILYLMIVRTIGAFNVFVIIQLLTGGGPYYKTSTIAFQLYKTVFQFNEYGLASTMGSILLVIVTILTVFQYRFLKSDFEY
ncbi:MAG: carbohydrate ABC transporter permease [Bacillota bacterium]